MALPNPHHKVVSSKVMSISIINWPSG